MTKFRDLDRVDFGKEEVLTNKQGIAYGVEIALNQGRDQILDTEFEVDVEKIAHIIYDFYNDMYEGDWSGWSEAQDLSVAIATHITEIIRGVK